MLHRNLFWLQNSDTFCKKIHTRRVCVCIVWLGKSVRSISIGCDLYTLPPSIRPCRVSSFTSNSFHSSFCFLNSIAGFYSNSLLYGLSVFHSVDRRCIAQMHFISWKCSHHTMSRRFLNFLYFRGTKPAHYFILSVLFIAFLWSIECCVSVCEWILLHTQIDFSQRIWCMMLCSMCVHIVQQSVFSPIGLFSLIGSIVSKRKYDNLSIKLWHISACHHLKKLSTITCTIVISYGIHIIFIYCRCRHCRWPVN